MQQYYRFKERHPGCVLLFRIGDFYEMFDQDAVDVSRAIGLTLTQRTEGVPMAGIPHHQLETYLRRLIIQGFRVAVCDQLVDAESFRAAGNKGVVPRAVVRVVSPGTVVEESLADSDSGGTLAAVAFTPPATPHPLPSQSSTSPPARSSSPTAPTARSPTSWHGAACANCSTPRTPTAPRRHACSRS